MKEKLDKELWKKIREIEIKTNKLVSNIFSGEYRSAFKGKGLDFKEFKEYEFGDDPKHIDWKLSAKKGHLHVKKFSEERELTVILALDISNSTFFGSQSQLKREFTAEFCASVAFSCTKNNDKVGLILFSDKVVSYIPPKKSRGHIIRLLKQILEVTYVEDTSKKTDLKQTFELINKLFSKKITLFLVSDFLNITFTKEIKAVAFKHDLISVFINDEREFELPKVKLLEVQDPETKEVFIVDTNSKNFQKLWTEKVLEKQKVITTELTKNKIDIIKLKTNTSFVKELTKFFKLRERRF